MQSVASILWGNPDEEEIVAGLVRNGWFVHEFQRDGGTPRRGVMLFGFDLSGADWLAGCWVGNGRDRDRERFWKRRGEKCEEANLD